MAALLSLLIVVTLSILVTRIATVALTHTGMSGEMARFQARSAFTGVGYTTSEAEKAVNHPVRRRIILLLMLLGNVGIVTSLSSLMLTFIDFGQDTSSWLKLGILGVGLGTLWLAASSRFIDKWLSRLISNALNRYTDIRARDYTSLLRLTGDYTITEMQISEDDWLADTRLNELNLTEEGILILGVTRPEGNYVGAPQPETKLKPGDSLLLYGRSGAMENLDKRRKGVSGDVEHDKAVEKQKKVVEEEQREEEQREKAEGKGHE